MKTYQIVRAIQDIVVFYVTDKITSQGYLYTSKV